MYHAILSAMLRLKSGDLLKRCLGSTLLLLHSQWSADQILKIKTASKHLNLIDDVQQLDCEYVANTEVVGHGLTLITHEKVLAEYCACQPCDIDGQFLARSLR